MTLLKLISPASFNGEVCSSVRQLECLSGEAWLIWLWTTTCNQKKKRFSHLLYSAYILVLDLATAQFCGTELTKITFFFHFLFFCFRVLVFTWVRELIQPISQLHCLTRVLSPQTGWQEDSATGNMEIMTSWADGCLQLGHRWRRCLWGDRIVFLHWPQRDPRMLV